MNNYYLLIYLKQVLIKNVLQGKFLFAVSPHKDVLDCYIEASDETYRLVVSSNPNETALFLDQYRPPKKQNVTYFFDELENIQIEEISLAKHDRLLTLRFENGYDLLFKLYGHDVNVLLVKNDIIKDAFKHPESVKGKQTPQPHQPEFADEVSGKAKPKNQLTKLNPLLPRNLLKPLIKQHQVNEMEPDEAKVFTKNITDAMLSDPHPRVLKNGKITLWSEEILSLPTQKLFSSVNEAVRFAYREAVHLRRLHTKKERMARFLNRLLKKKEAEYQQLLQADKSLKRADKYEKYGHLLMTKAHEKMPGRQNKLEVADVYENNAPLLIPVKNEHSIADNAQEYYEKAESSKKSYKNAKRRIPKIKSETDDIKSLLNELKKIEKLPVLEKWAKQRKKQLRMLGFGTDEDGQQSSPFRKFKAGKYEIWIGKNAKSNDKLTALAHKEDIWLHARGVAGSHTVIRMDNRKEYPPRKIVLRAASYAAYYSKAKGMKTAPVIVTKRKYIHKPKGASAGAVVVDREQVEMVPPMKPS